MIEVQIPSSVMERNSAHDVWCGNVVNTILREAGIPIEGKLFPQWPTTGYLTVHVDEDDITGKTYVYRWTALDAIGKMGQPPKKRRVVLDIGATVIKSGVDFPIEELDL